ncbi:CAP domain-containing protein [Tenuibacillus multivorans]|nr:CAP domain-containing protein [Tenuibacillus multivorans]
MFRPAVAMFIAILMSIILATGQVAASSQHDQSSQNVYEVNYFTMPLSLWFQGESNFDWQDLIDQFWNTNNWQNEPVEQEQPDNSTEKPSNDSDKNDNNHEPQQPKEEEPVEEQEPQQEQPAEEPQQEEPVETPANNGQDQVEEPTQDQVEQDQSQTSELKAFEQQVVDLVNQERQKRGLQPLEASVELSDVAREKSRDMANKNYFSHTSPTYGSPFDMMQQFGINYRTAGENIAMGQRSPEQVMNGWMNSDGHRKNILNGNFTHIGVGYVEANGQTYWTQMFIGK